LNASIDAKLSTMGPFASSDIILSWSNAATKARFPAASEVPSDATALQGFLELYPSTGHPAPTDVNVRWTVIGPSGPRDGGQTTTPVASADRMTAAVQLPIDSLPPGEYELDARVEIGGRTVGTVTTTFRKLNKDGLLPPGVWDWIAPSSHRPFGRR
jgi:hypothetical protein